MIRGAFLESILMEVYGQKPTDDAEITYNLVNLFLTEGIGTAAQAAYKGAIQLDGVGYVNNGFYTTFSGLAISQDSTDNLCYKFTLPEIPVGIANNMGVAEVRFKSSDGFTSLPGIPLSMNQWGYFDSMRPIPNKILYLPEGKYVRTKTTIILTPYTATVKMISEGDVSSLDSELNVPPDYLPICRQYIIEKLLAQRSIPTDNVNDGQDQNLKQL
jgi:hypothetical protein